VYGPAECTVASVAQRHLTEDMNSRNVGRGIGAVTWLVDPSNHECLMPLGTVGELLIEGPIVGRGYLGDQQKTDSSFIQSPSWLPDGCDSIPGRSSRLYKTGDLMRYESDGSLVYVGRKDLQVKLRGQRIELGDIEHHLANFLPPGTEIIAETITPDSKDGQALLVACIAEPKIDRTLNNGSDKMALSLASLLSNINEKLIGVVPRYMVPSLYVPVAQMPLTASGKIDRHQLREAARRMQSLARDTDISTIQPPQTDTEKALHELWARILDVLPASFGLESNFFRLGGESIAAMKLVGATRAAGHQGLNVGVVIRHPKLRDMASVIETHARLDVTGLDTETRKINGTSTSAEIPSFSLLGSQEIVTSIRMEAERQCSLNDGDIIEDIYPCTSMQESLTEFSLARPGTLMVQNVKEVSDATGVTSVQQAWENVVSSSAILRTSIIRSTELGLVQVVTKSGKSIDWKLEDDLATYLAKDLQIPIKLGVPLNRYALIKDRTTGKSYTVWTAHHSTYDGWSMLL
jgi:fusarinine C synthase